MEAAGLRTPPTKPQWARFFPSKNRKNNRNRLPFFVTRENRKALRGKGHFWGPEIAATLFFAPAYQKIVIAIAEKIATLVALSIVKRG